MHKTKLALQDFLPPMPLPTSLSKMKLSLTKSGISWRLWSPSLVASSSLKQPIFGDTKLNNKKKITLFYFPQSNCKSTLLKYFTPQNTKISSLNLNGHKSHRKAQNLIVSFRMQKQSMGDANSAHFASLVDPRRTWQRKQCPFCILGGPGHGKQNCVGGPGSIDIRCRLLHHQRSGAFNLVLSMARKEPLVL